MGNDESSSEKYPPSISPSRTNRKISPIKKEKISPIPNNHKKKNIKNIKNQSKLSKTLSSPKNIMNFISQCENAILLKNMNDSNSISLNHINILFNPDIINPFLESQLKYFQIVEDSIDKKILGKLKIQNKEFTQKQLDSLTNNLIEINNDNSLNMNWNLGNLSSIHKKKGKYLSREDSPTSQRDDELDLTSFSTTIGGKASHNISNVKSFGNNKMSNSKQVRTFKIRTKDGHSQGDIENNNNINIRNRTNNHSRNNSNNNSNNSSYKNNILRRDSLYSIHSNNSSDNNSNGNILSAINKTNNYQNKIPENTSIKEQIIKPNNNINNKIINRKKHNSCLSDINGFKTVNLTQKNSNKNTKNISKKIIRKKLIDPESIIGPKDNMKSQRRNYTNIDNSTINTFSNIQENLTYLDNNNYNINNTISDITTKKQNCILNKTTLSPDKITRAKSPNLILNNRDDEGENSRIIFNNVRPTIGTNYSRSNNNSSMLNNLINLSDLSSKKINNTNILNNDKYIKNYLGQNESSYLQTEVNKENNSYIKGVIKKKKIVQNKNINPFKKENDDYKKNKIESNCIKDIKKINNNKNKIINKTSITKEVTNNKVSKKEIKSNKNINETKALNNLKLNTNKNIIKKINTNYKTENIFNKKDSEQNSNKNKTTRLLLNPKKIEPKKSLTNKILVKNDFNQNNIKTNNSFKKNKEQSKKNIILFDDNLENINFLDDEYPEPQNSNLAKNQNINKENKEEKIKEKNLDEIKKKNKQENIIVDFNNKKRKIENNPENTNINPSINNNKNKNINQNQSNRHAIKKTKKKKNNKNIVFNIDLSNDIDNDFSKSEDVSDNSISNEDKIHINNFNEKNNQPIKEKSNIMNKKNINNMQTNLKEKENNNINNYQKKIFENKINKLIKRPKIRKETNLPNSNINRLIIEKQENNSENFDDLDDVCNFSGINNISCTNRDEKYHNNNNLFDDELEDYYQRAHSPKPIFHKKIKFDNNHKDINKNQSKEKNIYNKIDKPKINDFNYLDDEINNCNIINDKIKDDDFKYNIQKQEIKNHIDDENLKIENNQKHKKDNINNMNSNKIPNNIYSSNQGYFSFKIKKNNDKEKESIIEEKTENNKYKKNNESIAESVTSSKFNFKINDDIHESEFNDVEFLD